jgi:carbon-monoxide dehydrogenase medium subunit
MKPAAFSYHRAYDVAGTVGLLAELAAAGEDPKLLAGGQSLLPMMSFRLARPTALVDLGALRRRRLLTGMTVTDGALRIGALTTHHEVETGARVLGSGYRVLADAMRWVGHLPIRTRGTVAGSIVHGDATAEWCLLALLLDAEIVVEGPAGRRNIPAAEMFHGFYATAVEADELVVEVVFPRPAANAALTEYAQRHGDFATVAAAAALDIDGDRITGGRVVLGGVAPAVVRIPEAEEVLAVGGPAGQDLFAACGKAAAAAIDPPSDAHGDARYRRRLTAALVTRACTQAAGRRTDTTGPEDQR